MGIISLRSPEDPQLLLLSGGQWQNFPVPFVGPTLVPRSASAMVLPLFNHTSVCSFAFSLCWLLTCLYCISPGCFAFLINWIMCWYRHPSLSSLSTKQTGDLFSCLSVVVWCYFRCVGCSREPGTSDVHDVGLTGEPHPAKPAAGGQMGYPGVFKIEQMSISRHLAVSDQFHHLSCW